MSKTGAGEPAAEAWLNDLAAAHRYVADVWAG
jgi:sulfite reductase alpha subunit-like flavoprotein